jgi:hypothetical protein
LAYGSALLAEIARIRAAERLQVESERRRDVDDSRASGRIVPMDEQQHHPFRMI